MNIVYVFMGISLCQLFQNRSVKFSQMLSEERGHILAMLNMITVSISLLLPLLTVVQERRKFGWDIPYEFKPWQISMHLCSSSKTIWIIWTSKR